MPLPARETIVALGQRTKCLPDPMAELDALVTSVTSPPELQEAAVG